LDNCVSDIRIADFWGSKYAERDDGVSLVVVNAEKGKDVWHKMQDRFYGGEQCTFQDLLQSQPTRYLKENKCEISLAELRDEQLTLEKIYNRHHPPSLIMRVFRSARILLVSIVKLALGKALFNRIKKRIIYGK
jgi:hypothetical protein